MQKGGTQEKLRLIQILNQNLPSLWEVNQGIGNPLEQCLVYNISAKENGRTSSRCLWGEGDRSAIENLNKLSPYKAVKYTDATDTDILDILIL